MIHITCPACENEYPVHEKVIGKEKPVPGDFLKCYICNRYSKFILMLRLATEEEIKDAKSDPRFAKLADSEYN